MIERDVIVTTKHGNMPSFLVAPEAPQRHRGIIFSMDAPGIRQELRNMCRRRKTIRRTASAAEATSEEIYALWDRHLH